MRGTLRGVDVTLLCDGPRSARAERSLMRCEVADLIVLRDPRGEFRDVRALARTRAKKTLRALDRATSASLIEELTESQRGPAWNGLPPLREAALRFAAAWIYRRRGWRTPRWRTMRKVLPARAARRLERILGLPSADDSRRALAQMKRLMPLPGDAQARIRAGEWSEALLLARRCLEREVLARKKPPRWTRVSPAVAKSVQRMQGVPKGMGSPPPFALSERSESKGQRRAPNRRREPVEGLPTPRLGRRPARAEGLATTRAEVLALARELDVLSLFSHRVAQLLLEPRPR